VAPNVWGLKSKDLEVLAGTEDQPKSSMEGVSTPKEEKKKEDKKNED